MSPAIQNKAFADLAFRVRANLLPRLIPPPPLSSTDVLLANLEHMKGLLPIQRVSRLATAIPLFMEVCDWDPITNKLESLFDHETAIALGGNRTVVDNKFRDIAMQLLRRSETRVSV